MISLDQQGFARQCSTSCPLSTATPPENTPDALFSTVGTEDRSKPTNRARPAEHLMGSVPEDLDNTRVVLRDRMQETRSSLGSKDELYYVTPTQTPPATPPPHLPPRTANTHHGLQSPPDEPTIDSTLESHQDSASISTSNKSIDPEGRAVLGSDKPLSTDESPRDWDYDRAKVMSRLWNSQQWELVSPLLKEHEESMRVQKNLIALRRCHHLQGILHSIEGRWQHSISQFILALNTPITELSTIDQGTCAAAYWLGDIYAMHGRFEEAILAYSIAELNPSLTSHGSSLFSWLCSLELQVMHVDPTKPRFEQIPWIHNSISGGVPEGRAKDAGSIFDIRIISRDAAKSCVDVRPFLFDSRPPTYQDMQLPLESRARTLHRLSCLQQPTLRLPDYSLNIQTIELLGRSRWPAQYDPEFCLAHVAEGFGKDHVDLLQMLNQNGIGIMRSKGLNATNLHRNRRITHPDVVWLTKTVRDCLTKHDILWTEACDLHSCRFSCRRQHVRGGRATIVYFRISMFKRSLHRGYAIYVGPFSSARIFEGDDRWLQVLELEWWTLIRDFIESKSIGWNL